MSEYKLTKEIIDKSLSKNWDEAKLEWKLLEVYKSKEYDSCLCGHFPITEICILKNVNSNQRVIVGNCCVNKFIGLNSDKIFQAIIRVQKDNKKSFNAETVDHAYKKRWINNWEKDFYFNIMRRVKLTQSQRNKKIQINTKILARLVK